MADLLYLLNSDTALKSAVSGINFPTPHVITSSGTTQVLSFDIGSKETTWDVTLGANTTFTIDATNVIAGSRLKLILRQDMTAGRIPTLPTGLGVPNGTYPTLNTTLNYKDVLFFTYDGSRFDLTIEGLKVTAASISIAAFSSTTPAGNPLTVQGSIVGVMPNNLDYSLDKGITWTTLAAGNATLSNGAFTFSITAPAMGPQTIRVRETNNTGVISTDQAFTTTAATPPATAHYMNLGTGQSGISCGAYTNGTTAQDTSAGYLDMDVWFNPASLAATTNTRLFGKFNFQNDSSTNSSWSMILGNNGSTANSFGYEMRDGSSNYFSNYWTAPTAFAAGTDFRIRLVINASNVAVTDRYGTSQAANSATAYWSTATAKPTTTAGWTSLGSMTAGTTAGFKAVGTANPIAIAAYSTTTSPLNPLKGKFYTAYVSDNTGKILANPDFTAQTTNVTSFPDTAGTVNTWQFSGTASEA